jgi:hypothetical protein
MIKKQTGHHDVVVTVRTASGSHHGFMAKLLISQRLPVAPWLFRMCLRELPEAGCAEKHR